jgi:Immunity protein family (Imm11)
LSVRCPKKAGKFYVYNVTYCVDVLDKRKCRYEYPKDPDYKGDIVKFAFQADRIGEHTLFKLADVPVDIFCVERTSDPEDEEFKALIEANELKGIRFELVWTNAKRRKGVTRTRKTTNK